MGSGGGGAIVVVNSLSRFVPIAIELIRFRNVGSTIDEIAVGIISFFRGGIAACAARGCRVVPGLHFVWLTILRMVVYILRLGRLFGITQSGRR